MVSLRPVAGLHVYVLAPDAVSIVLEPSQIDVVPLMVTTGNGSTVTACFAILEQEVTVFVPVTV